MNATSGGLSLPLGSEPLSRFGRLRRLKARASAMLATAALVAVPALVTVNVVNAPAAAAATTCSQTGGTSIANITEFSLPLTKRTLVSGTANTVGAVYRYTAADSGGLYDVLVTITSVVDTDGNPTGGNYLNPPSIDREASPLVAGQEYLYTPTWDFVSGGTAGQVQTSSITSRLDFVATGTNTPVSLNVMATTLDNDGATYTNSGTTVAQAQEFVKYETLPDSWMKASVSLMTPQSDGTVMGLSGGATLPNVTVEKTASITGIYSNVSSITWTQGNNVTYLLTGNGGSSVRMGALSLKCEDISGIATTDLVLAKTLNTATPIFPGQTVTYTLTPSNEGFATAATGWKVVDLPQSGLTVTAMSGTGYTCTLATLTCQSNSALAGLTTANPITVTATVNAGPGTTLRNVAYVAPSATDTVAETVPLGTLPTSATDTTTTTTNNDSQAVLTVASPAATIVLVKSITGVADTNGDGWIGIGDTVSYKFSVTNTGNVTLAPVTITDTKLGLTGAACVPTLAPGASADCSTTGSYVIQQTDIDAGGVVNSATVSGTPPGGLGIGSATDVSDTGTAPSTPAAFTTVPTPATTETAYPAGVTQSFPNNSTNPTEDPTVLTLATPQASISLVKSITGVVDTTGDGWIGVGDTVSYKFVVTNTGNVTLTPVTITDTTLGLTNAACVPTLAAGATADCSTTGSYVIQQRDVDAGGVVNTATATGTPPASTGLAPVSDVSDTGTAPNGAGAFTGVDAPETSETAIPGGVSTAVGNDAADPTEDPTVLTLATPLASISLVKSITGVADTNGDGWIGIGDTVSYKFVVTNTGNVTLAPVTITDTTLGLTDAACVPTLAAGATADCSTTGSYVIQQGDVDAGGVVNTATTTGTPPVSTGLTSVSDVSDTGTAPNGPGAFTGVDTPEDSETAIPAGVSTAVGNDAADPTEDPTVLTLATPVASIVLVKSITGVVDTTGDGWIGVGDTVSYKFVVTNTGNVALAPVTITDDTLGLTDAACVSTLAAGASADCSTTGSYVIQQGDVDAGGVVNTATATGTPPPSSGLAPVADVSDTGTAPNGPGAFTGVDTPGTRETAYPTGLTTTIENSTADPTEDPTVLTLATPVASISLVKSITGVVDTTGDGWIGVGDTVSYKFVVTNTGNVTLAPVTITDDVLLLTDAACVDSLAAGATAQCSTTGSYVIQQSDVDAGGVVNSASASGLPPASTGLAPATDVSDTGTAPDGPGAFTGVDTPGTTETAYPAGVSTSIGNDAADPTEDPTVLTLATPVASISVTKRVTDVLDTNGSGAVDPGDTITYAFSVTNTGNVTLAPVTVSDDLLGLTDAACVPSLTAGASADCSTTGSYVITEDDLLAGGVVNTATATGTPPSWSQLADVTDVSDTGTEPSAPGRVVTVDGNEAAETAIPAGVTTSIANDPAVPGDDPTVVTLPAPVARIVLVKSVSGVADSNGSGAVDAGDTVSYAFSVTNTGNVTLAPVTVSDDLLGLSGAACVDSLASGATVSCSTTGSYVITEADLFAGGVVNTATASGVPPVVSGLEPVSDVSDTGTAPTAPGVVVGVDGPEGVETPIPAGVSTSIVNDGADLGEDPTVVTLPAPVASIVLVKSVTGVVDTTGDGLIGVGDTVSYAFSVTNTGNVTLAPVTVSDAMLGLTDAACVASLAPRETLPCSTTGSYVLLQADVDAGGVENTATATGVPPVASGLDPVTDVSDTGTTPQGDVVDEPGVTETGNPLAVNPNDPAVPGDDPTTALITPVARIVLVKSVSGVADSNGSGAVDAGDTVSYAFSVTNTGNVTLAPVTVSDDLLGLSGAACVDSLASGATVSCSTTGSYVITEADLFAGGVVNTATASGVPPVVSGLEPVSDVSDTGTAPTAPGVVVGVDGPEGVETPIPAGVSTSIVNDGADLGEDPTVVTLPAPVASIVLVKSVTGVVDTTGDGLIGVGDTVSYAFSVTNTGNVTLAPVTVSDAMLGLTDAACVASLAPRETLPCSTTGSYVLLQADVDAGGVENTATATGVPPVASGLDPVTDVSDTGTTPQGDVVDEPGVTETGNPLAVNPNDPAVPGDDPTTALITPVARIVLVKSVSGVADSNGSGAVDAGDTVSYAFSVTNTGNVTLAPVTVSDDLLGLSGAACVDSLASGATVSCSTTGSYVKGQ